MFVEGNIKINWYSLICVLTRMPRWIQAFLTVPTPLKNYFADLPHGIYLNENSPAKEGCPVCILATKSGCCLCCKKVTSATRWSNVIELLFSSKFWLTNWLSKNSKIKQVTKCYPWEKHGNNKLDAYAKQIYEVTATKIHALNMWTSTSPGMEKVLSFQTIQHL